MLFGESSVIAFVPALKRHWAVVQEELVKVAQKMELEDRLYIYHPNYLKILSNAGNAVANIANYLPYKFNLSIALEDTLFMVGPEQGKKHIFILSDWHDESWSFPLESLERINKRDRFECKVHLCHIDCEGPGLQLTPQVSEHIIKEVWENYG